MNIVIFTGHLGKDCRFNASGSTPVANFSVPLTEGYGDHKKTHWVECALWGKRAEAMKQYLVKGQHVCVSGEIGMKEATGDYKAQLTCRVTEIELLGKKADGEKQAEKPADKPQPAAPSAGGFDDDILFARVTSNYSF